MLSTLPPSIIIIGRWKIPAINVKHMLIIGPTVALFLLPNLSFSLRLITEIIAHIWCFTCLQWPDCTLSNLYCEGTDCRLMTQSIAIAGPMDWTEQTNGPHPHRCCNRRSDPA